MRVTHHVDIVLLHQFDVQFHQLLAHGTSQLRMLVSVGSLHQYRNAVDAETSVFDFRGTEADLSNLWQAYQNNLQMLNLERQNLVAAKENHEIAMERYMLGNLSGIEMREAQKSLLDAEERILSAEYDTKLCEISLLQISGKVARYME